MTNSQHDATHQLIANTKPVLQVFKEKGENKWVRETEKEDEKIGSVQKDFQDHKNES